MYYVNYNICTNKYKIGIVIYAFIIKDVYTRDNDIVYFYIAENYSLFYYKYVITSYNIRTYTYEHAHTHTHTQKEQYMLYIKKKLKKYIYIQTSHSKPHTRSFSTAIFVTSKSQETCISINSL